MTVASKPRLVSHLIRLKVAIVAELLKSSRPGSSKDGSKIMEEETQPKGATIVKDLLEATVGLAVLDACMCACGVAVPHRARENGFCFSQGVRHYDAAVVTQLLEFLYRYTSDVLESAQVPAVPCRSDIDSVQYVQLSAVLKSGKRSVHVSGCHAMPCAIAWMSAVLHIKRTPGMDWR